MILDRAVFVSYTADRVGAVIVYDITDAESFEKAKNWVKELRKMVGNDIVVVLAANKLDLERNRKVEVGDAERYQR